MNISKTQTILVFLISLTLIGITSLIFDYKNPLAQSSGQCSEEIHYPEGKVQIWRMVQLDDQSNEWDEHKAPITGMLASQYTCMAMSWWDELDLNEDGCERHYIWTAVGDTNRNEDPEVWYVRGQFPGGNNREDHSNVDVDVACFANDIIDFWPDDLFPQYNRKKLFEPNSDITCSERDHCDCVQ